MTEKEKEEAFWSVGNALYLEVGGVTWMHTYVNSHSCTLPSFALYHISVIFQLIKKFREERKNLELELPVFNEKFSQQKAFLKERVY